MRAEETEPDPLVLQTDLCQALFMIGQLRKLPIVVVDRIVWNLEGLVTVTHPKITIIKRMSKRWFRVVVRASDG